MSSVGCIGSSNSIVMQGMHATKRPVPAEMAESLFSKLDTSGQGYIQKSDLQNAFDKVSSSSDSTSTSTSVDELFSQLDTNSDGKVTKAEFSDTLQKLSDQLEQQFQNSRMQGAMAAGGMNGMGPMGGMPPPPPPQNDEGFTKDELSSQLEQIGNSDDERSSLISSIVENFDAADTNSDGKVSFREAMAYQQDTSSTSARGTAADPGATSDTAASSTSSNLEAKLMLQIMRLMHAYGASNGSDATAASSLSVTV